MFFNSPSPTTYAKVSVSKYGKARLPDVGKFSEECGDAAHHAAHQEGGAENAEEVGDGLHYVDCREGAVALALGYILLVVLQRLRKHWTVFFH